MRSTTASRLYAFVAFCLIETALSAQISDSRKFDVASVKPVGRELLTQRGLACGFVPGGRFMAFGTAGWLIACAYEIPPARKELQITGGPPWLDGDLFEVRASAPTDAIPKSQSEGLVMLRSLLDDRFKLSVHHETKEIPAYSLVIARRDGKLGPKLVHTADDCVTWITNGRRGMPPTRSGDQPPCFRQAVGPSNIQWTGMPLTRLADVLSSRLRRPVLDRTGLTGYFDLDLQWERETPAGEITPGAPLEASSLPTSISTALEEQLGLKVQPSKAPVDVLVIDHIERPSEN